MALKLIKHTGEYIGRTNDYYNDDDESVFTPEYWTYSLDKESDEFASEGPVFELNEEGLSLLRDLRKAQGFNQWQAEHSSQRCRDLYHRSWNSVWEDLTDASMVVPSDDSLDGTEIHVDVCFEEEGWQSKDEVQHYCFRDTRLEVAYENACDCLYYGEGRSTWQPGELTPEEQDIVWQLASDALENDYRY